MKGLKHTGLEDLVDFDYILLSLVKSLKISDKLPASMAQMVAMTTVFQSQFTSAPSRSLTCFMLSRRRESRDQLTPRAITVNTRKPESWA